MKPSSRPPSIFSRRKGFDGTSVRDIVTKARVNQAAINYHFKSKDGLYLEVLKTAFEKLTTDAGFDPEKLKTFSREQALRSFLRQQLRPLLLRDDMSRYIRLFAWESAHPSKIFLKFMATNTIILYDRCGRYRAQISVTSRTAADCAMRSHLADGSMQRLRAKPGAACARAVQYYGRRAICGRIDRAGYQVGHGRLAESQPNSVITNRLTALRIAMTCRVSPDPLCLRRCGPAGAKLINTLGNT